MNLVSSDIGFLIRESNILLDRLFNQLSLSYDVRGGTQGRVIRYLHNHNNEIIYQKTLEKRFAVRSSTMTKILDALENDGFIARVKNDDDSRLKRIILLPKGEDECIKMNKQVCEFERRIKRDLTDSECQQLISYLQTIINNLKEETGKE